MYFVEKINEGEGKLIRHNYIDDAGKNQTNSVALCYSEEIASFITIALNLYEKGDFINTLKNLINFLSQYLQRYSNKQKNISELDDAVDMISHIVQIKEIIKKLESI